MLQFPAGHVVFTTRDGTVLSSIETEKINNKKSINFNNEYFNSRSYEKNALAISSDQSKIISSYKDVI